MFEMYMILIKIIVRITSFIKNLRENYTHFKRMLIF